MMDEEMNPADFPIKGPHKASVLCAAVDMTRCQFDEFIQRIVFVSLPKGVNVALTKFENDLSGTVVDQKVLESRIEL